MSDNLPNRRTLVAAVLLLAAAAALGVYSLAYRPDASTGHGAALVGGPFTMVNHKGQTVSEKTFAGKFMLVFFGFTFCPDVCPTELQVMSEALNRLGPEGENVTPVFVSVDPARDTPEAVANYISSFHPRFVGLTGSAEQVAIVAKAYRVFYQKVDNPKRPQDYTMDHTSIIFLMAPDGTFRKHFAYTTDPAVLADGIRQAMGD